MGIGNLKQVRAQTRRSLRTHYPSWGSETRPPGAAAGTGGAGLITPHGDRKPRQPPPAPTSAPRLITPHGDRKPGAVRLITPHGDRKLIQPQTQQHDGGVSLPLMGIGNLACLSLRRRASSAHYPSWGSETGHRPPAGRAAGSHYPSWGSETRGAAFAGARRRWSSLPLMGIGNPADAGEARLTCSDSLPLMGIGNRARRLPGRRVFHSLPLMGIGNPRRVALTPPITSAHYPSWGSETVPPA